ncbi:MAG: WYL domain-containing protein [Pasteurella sp.]|nr:WYL domain-containing protein [Pasteurella sp.]
MKPIGKHERLADRLSDIIIRLNQGERLKVDDLADEYKVSIRTIKRDFNRLSMLFFSETGQYYRLDKAKQGYLNTREIQRFANFASVADLLPEIDRKFFQDKLNQSILVKGFEYENIKNKKQAFDAINQAINDNKIITFNYKKVRQSSTDNSPNNKTQTNKNKTYTLAPYHLLNKNGIWYVVGLYEQQQRIFCFTQIENLSVTDEQFDCDETIKAEMINTDSLFFGNRISEIIVQVSHTVAGYFERRDLLPNQEIIRKTENGDLLLACKNVNAREVVPIVQYWIPHLRIISPSEVQGQMEQGLRDYLGK